MEFKGTLAIFLVAFMMLAASFSTPVFAVDGDPPGLFELDGNPQEGAANGDDWETLYNDCGDDGINDSNPALPCGNSGAFTGVKADPAPTSIFWKGGSKDTLDIPNWWHKDGSVPDKDDLTNAYAAAYLVPNDVCLNGSGDPVLCTDGTAIPGAVHDQGDLIIYFGADRFATNGDAFLGFWLFQDNVTLTSNQFDGQHTVDDILVVLDYPQSFGATPDISIFKWVLSGGSESDHLDLVGTFAGAECDQNGNKDACAIVNLTEVGSPWDYIPKGSGVDSPFPEQSFFSGGINITGILGSTPCINSFMVESRSSKSVTAQLKDFVLAGFSLCSTEAVTELHKGAKATSHTVLPVGGSMVVGIIHDSVTVTGTLLGASGGAIPDPEGDVTFTLYDNGTCDGAVLDTSTATLVGNGDGTSTAESADFTITLPGAYSYKAIYPPDQDDTFPVGAEADCEPFTAFQPELKINKDVNTCLDPDTDDSGTFDLYFGPEGGSLVLAPNGSGKKDGETTGFFGVNPGAYEVGEVAASTDEYVKKFDTSGDCIGGTVTLAGNDQKTCTITNIRKPHLIVKKVIIGTPPDNGLFDLQVNGTTVDSGNTPSDTTYISGDGSDVGNGAEVRIRIDDDTLLGDPANFGNFTVGETAVGAGTSLSNYQTSILCNNRAQTQAVFLSTFGSPRSVSGINLEAGEVVTCTITNIVRPAAAPCPSQ
jgi:hypothetical protein